MFYPIQLLLAKHINTGMGFECVVSVLQDKMSNYDTDIFMPVIVRIQELTGVHPFTRKIGAGDVDGIDTTHRVIADHVRMLSLSNGGISNNVGRRYVLHRILH